MLFKYILRSSVPTDTDNQVTNTENCSTTNSRNVGCFKIHTRFKADDEGGSNISRLKRVQWSSMERRTTLESFKRRDQSGNAPKSIYVEYHTVGHLCTSFDISRRVFIWRRTPEYVEVNSVPGPDPAFRRPHKAGQPIRGCLPRERPVWPFRCKQSKLRSFLSSFRHRITADLCRLKISGTYS